MDGNKGHAVLRDILRITNYYVRDRQMSQILRSSVLTQAHRESTENTWEKNIEKWISTLDFFKSSFAVNQSMNGEHIRLLELYKSIESSRIFSEPLPTLED